MGRVLNHGVPQRKLALFRVGSGYYECIDDPGWTALDMEVHEHPVFDGPVGEIAEPIEHEDFRGLHHIIGRHNEYSSWEAQRYISLIKDPVAWDRLTPRQKLKYRNLRRWWYAPAYFVATYFWKLGFFDGGPGVMPCLNTILLRNPCKDLGTRSRTAKRGVNLENCSPLDVDRLDSMSAKGYHFDPPAEGCHHKYLIPEILSILRLEGAKRVFDLGCGNGFVAHLLEKNGYDVTGAVSI